MVAVTPEFGKPLLILWVFACVWAALCLGIYRGCCGVERRVQLGESGCVCCAVVVWWLAFMGIATLSAPGFFFVVILIVGAFLHRKFGRLNPHFFDALVFFTVYLLVLCLAALPFAIGFFAVLSGGRSFDFPAAWWPFIAGFFFAAPLFSPIAVGVVRRVRASLLAIK